MRGWAIVSNYLHYNIWWRHNLSLGAWWDFVRHSCVPKLSPCNIMCPLLLAHQQLRGISRNWGEDDRVITPFGLISTHLQRSRTLHYIHCHHHCYPARQTTITTTTSTPTFLDPHKAATMIGRRQPWAFDGGGGIGRGGCQSTFSRCALGMPLVWIVLMLLQMRITEAKIGNYVLNISFNYL